MGGSFRSVELWQGIVWGQFRDSWPNIFINNVEVIAGRDGGCRSRLWVLL